MCASSGSTTVGPETTRIAPISNGTSVPMPLYSSATEPATASHVTTRPIDTSFTTTPRILGVTSRNESLSPASNRITPTATDTNGWYKDPSRSLGCTSVVRMPAMNPTGSRTTIAGSRRPLATSCEPTASTRTSPIPRSRALVVTAIVRVRASRHADLTRLR